MFAASPIAAFPLFVFIAILAFVMVTMMPSPRALGDLCGGPGQPPWKSQGRCVHLLRGGPAAASAAAFSVSCDVCRP